MRSQIYRFLFADRLIRLLYYLPMEMTKKEEKKSEGVNIGLIENAYIELSNPNLTIGEGKQIWKRLKVAVSDEEIERFNNILMEEYNLDRCSKLGILIPAVMRGFLNSMEVELALIEEKYGDKSDL